MAALRARQRRIDLLLLAHGAHIPEQAELLAAAQAADVPVKLASRAQLDAMAHSRSHGGVIAVASPKPRLPFDRLLALLDSLTTPPLLLLLEGIDDARNLGFTLRTAEAAGAHAVLLKKHLWDFDETEVSRPSSGAYERLPLVQLDSAEPLRALRRRGVRLLGCIAGVRRTIYQTRLSGPVCLAIGGEKRGLSAAVRSACDRFVTIPTVPGAASLPLVSAASAVLSEALRQRLRSDTPLPAGTPPPQPPAV